MKSCSVRSCSVRSCAVKRCAARSCAVGRRAFGNCFIEILPPSSRLAAALATALLLCVAGVTARVARAQASVPVQSGGPNSQAANAAPAPLNAFAGKLKPSAKKTGTLSSQPYQPIQRQDDQGQIPEIEMFVGESRVFPAPGVGRIAVGNGQIMTAAALDKREVIMFANAVGTSSLFLWNEDGRYQRLKVNIVPGDTSRFAREIAAFLSNIPNTRASIIGDKVVVEGENLSDRDLAKIDELARRYPQVVNFTDRLGWEPMVMLDVKVVEFPIDELRELGLKWSAAGGATVGAIWSPARYGKQPGLQVSIPAGTSGLPVVNADGSTNGIPLPSSPTLLSALNLGLMGQLQALAQNGKASILAEPQLAARSGSKASFLAGGEVPYSVANVNGVTVIYKSYGVKLDILPRVDRNGTVRATVESEVSKIDASINTTGGPALLTRKTNTEFNLASGETLVLSGLVQVDNSTTIDKVPLLGDIPILGALFRSKRFQNRETELVVFVTPTVVDSRTPELADRIERTKERLQENLGRPAPYLREPLQQGRDLGHMPSAPPPVPQPTQPVINTPVILAPPAAKAVTANPPPASDAPARRYRVRLDRLALRVSPDINAPILDHLPRHSLVQALPQAPTAYWQPVLADGKRGWVARQWLLPEP